MKSYQLKGSKATWVLFALFFLVLMTKIIAFQWFTFHSVCISSLWEAPIKFFGFWFPKIAMALFLSVFVFLSKRKWWTVIISLVIDIWIIANVIYYRANNTFLIWEAIMIVNNLSGFESSIGAYWTSQCFVYIISTILLFITMFFLSPKQKMRPFVVLWVVLIPIWAIGAVCARNIYPDNKLWETCQPFYTSQRVRHEYWTWGMLEAEIYQHSIISYFPKMLTGAFVDAISKTNPPKISLEDNTILDTLCDGDLHPQPQRGIVFILVESLEDWALHTKDESDQEFLPNIAGLLQEDCFYCSKIQSQVSHGVSSDGQLITQTGLLPLHTDVTAIAYGNNTYPNYAGLYDNSVIINPCPGVWNKQIVFKSYGYKQFLEPREQLGKRWWDSDLFAALNTCSTENLLPCIVVLTIDSHSPFDHVPVNNNLHFDPNMPQVLKEYLNSLHNTDSCFGVWYNEWKHTEQAQNTVLVITGDHTVFSNALLHEYMPYIQQNGLNSIAEGTYCPLIIVSPDINEHQELHEKSYQMDIFPTVLSAIGADEYFWKGFGKNLLDTNAIRIVDEKQAMELSSKLIQNDYFKNTPKVH